MKYKEIKIYPKKEELDGLVEALTAAGRGDLVINDPGELEGIMRAREEHVWDYVDPEVIEDLQGNPYVCFYLQEGEDDPAAMDVAKAYDFTVTRVDDEDWLHKWEEYFMPTKITPRFVVKPAWRTYEPAEGEDGEELPEEPEEALPQESPLCFAGKDYTVTADFGPEAGFPQGTELRVREILPGTAEYSRYCGQTDEILNENWNETADFARFFDITFVCEEQEIEPQATVDVQITFDEAIPVAEENDVRTIHFAENGATLISSDTQSADAAADDGTAVDTVAFSSDRFSVYGVVQTVQMTENVIAADGQAYRIEVTYGRESDIPVNAALAVREILPEDSRYGVYLEEALQAAGYNMSEYKDIETAERYARFFDIEILANDEKTEPQANVSVSIALADIPSAEENKLKVIHFAEAETVVIDADIATDIQFDTDSFSIYILMGADIHISRQIHDIEHQ